MGIPIYIENNELRVAMTPWEFLRYFAASDEGREQVSKEIAEIQELLNGLCTNCGTCCKQTEFLKLHQYETPRIAFLLRKHFGIDAVERHILYRPIPFNHFTQYVFMFKDKCPFWIDNSCLISEDRPLVCKMYPIYLEMFVDRETPLHRQEIACSTSIHDNAACAKKSRRIHEVLHTAQNADLVRAVLWDLLEDRPEDIAFIFGRPSEEMNSRRHVNIEGLSRDFIGQLALILLQRYNEILEGIPNVLRSPETAGAVRIDREHAKSISTKEAWDQAVQSAKDSLTRWQSEYAELVRKEFVKTRK